MTDLDKRLYSVIDKVAENAYRCDDPKMYGEWVNDAVLEVNQAFKDAGYRIPQRIIEIPLGAKGWTNSSGKIEFF